MPVLEAILERDDMLATIASAPRERRLSMTYEEFLSWANEDVHAEWVDGEVIVFMPPKTKHQQVAGFLYKLLGLFVEFADLGELLAAPFEMRLSRSAREPDILFVAKEHLERLTPERLVGPADLVVEIVSDESARRDRVEKFNEYMEAGVREYWVIDARPGREQADVWVLDEQGRYQARAVDEEGRYHAAVLPEFWLEVDWLWQSPLPSAQAAFAEIIGPDRLIATLQEMKKD